MQTICQRNETLCTVINSRYVCSLFISNNNNNNNNKSNSRSELDLQAQVAQESRFSVISNAESLSNIPTRNLTPTKQDPTSNPDKNRTANINRFRELDEDEKNIDNAYFDGDSKFDVETYSTSSSTHGRTVYREDLRASAEKILLLYLTPGAEREVILPRTIVEPIQIAINKEGRDDPEVFEKAREYIFRAMEREIYPGFLQTKAFGNLVPLSALIRLVIGLFALFAAFWASFVLVFLDKSSSLRAYISIPFAVAFYGIVTWGYNLDPVVALAGYSESTFGQFRRIKHYYARKLLIRRSLVCIALWLAGTAAFTCLFVFVPGRYL